MSLSPESGGADLRRAAGWPPKRRESDSDSLLFGANIDNELMNRIL
jgi:hypothetical protein